MEMCLGKRERAGERWVDVGGGRVRPRPKQTNTNHSYYSLAMNGPKLSFDADAFDKYNELTW